MERAAKRERNKGSGRMSGLRGSNPSNWLGKPGHYHYAKPALDRFYLTLEADGNQGGFRARPEDDFATFIDHGVDAGADRGPRADHERRVLGVIRLARVDAV